MATSAELHDLIDRNRLVSRTAEMVRIPSVNPFARAALDSPAPTGDEGEAKIGEWYESQLRHLGYETTTQDVVAGRPNVSGIGPGGDGPVLALVGHLDTVGVTGYEDPFSGRIENGRVYGRGACDMKGALACFLEVAEVLAATGHKLHGRLMIVGLADEEFGMLGSQRFDTPHPIDWAIVGEPTDLYICNAHLGQYAFTVRTTGRAVHSSVANQGVNAIEAMAKIVGIIPNYRDELANGVRHPVCGTGTVNAGVIRGGDMVSIVPDLCEMEIDRRLVPGEDSSTVRAEFASRLHVLGTGDDQFRWEFGDVLVDSLPLDTPESSTIVDAAQRAAGSFSSPSESVAFPAATDAPNLGVPAIVWGPGSLRQAHTVDEYVEADDLVTASHLYLETVLRLLS